MNDLAASHKNGQTAEARGPAAGPRQPDACPQPPFRRLPGSRRSPPRWRRPNSASARARPPGSQPSGAQGVPLCRLLGVAPSRYSGRLDPPARRLTLPSRCSHPKRRRMGPGSGGRIRRRSRHGRRSCGRARPGRRYRQIRRSRAGRSRRLDHRRGERAIGIERALGHDSSPTATLSRVGAETPRTDTWSRTRLDRDRLAGRGRNHDRRGRLAGDRALDGAGRDGDRGRGEVARGSTVPWAEIRTPTTSALGVTVAPASVYVVDESASASSTSRRTG